MYIFKVNLSSKGPLDHIYVPLYSINDETSTTLGSILPDFLQWESTLSQEQNKIQQEYEEKNTKITCKKRTNTKSRTYKYDKYNSLISIIYPLLSTTIGILSIVFLWIYYRKYIRRNSIKDNDRKRYTTKIIKREKITNTVPSKIQNKTPSLLYRISNAYISLQIYPLNSLNMYLRNNTSNNDDNNINQHRNINEYNIIKNKIYDLIINSEELKRPYFPAKLRNYHNLCFFNSIINSLACIPDFELEIRSLIQQYPKNIQLQSILYTINNPQKPEIYKLYKVIIKILQKYKDKNLQTFDNYKQHDAQEFFIKFIYLLEDIYLSRTISCRLDVNNLLKRDIDRTTNSNTTISQGLKPNSNDNIIKKSFKGLEANIYTCTKCNNTRRYNISETCMQIQPIEQDIKPISQYECQRSYSSLESIDNTYCEYCSLKSTIDTVNIAIKDAVDEYNRIKNKTKDVVDDSEIITGTVFIIPEKSLCDDDTSILRNKPINNSNNITTNSLQQRAIRSILEKSTFNEQCRAISKKNIIKTEKNIKKSNKSLLSLYKEKACINSNIEEIPQIFQHRSEIYRQIYGYGYNRYSICNTILKDINTIEYNKVKDIVQLQLQLQLQNNSLYQYNESRTINKLYNSNTNKNVPNIIPYFWYISKKFIPRFQNSSIYNHFLIPFNKVQTTTIKKALLIKFPPILVLHINRLNIEKKVSTKVIFPIVLHLKEFVKDQYKYIRIYDKNIQYTCDNVDTDDDDDNDILYELLSVVEHIGSSGSSGHYICYTKHWNIQAYEQQNRGRGGISFDEKTIQFPSTLPPPKSVWYYQSDEVVYEVSEERVLNSNPYMLFYRHVV